MIPIRLNFKDIADLNEDLKASPRALTAIAQRVLSLRLRELRRELLPRVPRGRTGQLRRSFGASVRRQRASGGIRAVFGFLTGRRIPAGAVIAGNVLQKGSAVPRKRAYIWVPLQSNRNVTPQDFFNAENTFIRMSRAGNKIAFVRSGGQAVPLFVLKPWIKPSAPPVPINEGVERKLPEITQDIQTMIAEVIAARRKVLEYHGG
jgi:hypothetical protein